MASASCVCTLRFKLWFTLRQNKKYICYLFFAFLPQRPWLVFKFLNQTWNMISQGNSLWCKFFDKTQVTSNEVCTCVVENLEIIKKVSLELEAENPKFWFSKFSTIYFVLLELVCTLRGSFVLKYGQRVSISKNEETKKATIWCYIHTEIMDECSTRSKSEYVRYFGKKLNISSSLIPWSVCLPCIRRAHNFLISFMKDLIKQLSICFNLKL